MITDEDIARARREGHRLGVIVEKAHWHNGELVPGSPPCWIDKKAHRAWVQDLEEVARLAGQR